MRLSFRILPVFLLVLSLCTDASAASDPNHGYISGKIKTASGNPLHNAFVSIFKVAQREKILAVTGIRSNSGGFFRASNLTPGEYYLQVRREGYQSFSTDKFTVEPNRTISLSITLENLIDLISNDDDPRNWDLKTVMRSSSDGRMIFRYLPLAGPDADSDTEDAFSRSGAMSMASSTSPTSMRFMSHPQTSQDGVVTNFAFSEPLKRNSRMIFSGQFDVGRSTFWRVRDTINYRPDDNHDYRVSFGYGRMNLDYSDKDSFFSQAMDKDQGSRESRIQSIAFGMEGTTKFYNLLSVNYGFDYSHLRYGTDDNFINPSLKIVLSPAEGWQFSTAYTSRRESDVNSVVLSTGEVLNLSEPTLITVVGDDIRMSHVRHSEVALKRTITPETTLGLAIYRDNTYGPGIPLMVTMITPDGQTSTVVNLNENRSRQQGMRVTMNRRILPNLSGSLAYVYGEAVSIADVDASLPVERLNGKFQTYAVQQYHHSFTGKLDVAIPETNTKLLATIRWYPGNPVSTIDWFSDPMDIGSKSLNFEIRQAIPFQDAFLNTGWWEILLDFRNVLNQGEDIIPASNGTLVLNRSPRSLRFGLSLNFR